MKCRHPSTGCNQPITDFSCPGPSLTEIKEIDPAAYRALINSQKGEQTIDDDNAMGSLCHQDGFCANPDYSMSQYCACVNSAVPWPACALGACNANEYAYKPTDQQAWLTTQQCPSGLVICQNIAEYGGSGNVSDLYQNFNCGGVVNNFSNNILAHPYLSIFILVLVMFLMVLIVRPSTTRKPSAFLPPPELIMHL